MNAVTPTVPAVEESVGMDLLRLRDVGQCKYPVSSDGRHHLFCGKPSRGSWCPVHSRVVFIPPEQRRRLR